MDINTIRYKILDALSAVDLEKMSLPDINFYVDIVKKTSEIMAREENNQYIDTLSGMIERMYTSTPKPYVPPTIGELKKDGE